MIKEERIKKKIYEYLKFIYQTIRYDIINTIFFVHPVVVYDEGRTSCCPLDDFKVKEK